MALSTGIFSTVLCVKTAPLRSSPFLRVSSPHPANLRMVRAVTSATAASSEPSATKTREPRGIMKPRPVSPEMQDVWNGSEFSMMFVQSLRGDPFRDFNMSVLATYTRPSSVSEIVKVNMLAPRDNIEEQSCGLHCYPSNSMGG
ncbi:hypothetical protein F2Q70_00033973 [Brassica cretica]|uniref:Uncharacterized protein n=1 Tax=Brassica cretica TaxID=69181 RepID=A0A8S9JXU6_BRACR|nr:hypothetical protein F2Q70_00033973 [Brassica cretica]